MNRMLHAGLDVGSTTVKLVVLDEESKLIYSKYERHYSDFRKTIIELLKQADKLFHNDRLTLNVTGSGGLTVSKWFDVTFVQEVIACTKTVETLLDDIDVAVELGGEDAKITYFKNGVEQRMNGTCAGGTGAFIDQMAALLNTDAFGLNELAKDYETIYPIAARCGVFAKSDVQPLINEGAKKADIAVSIFQAVVNQTISGLACGRKIKGKVVFLGGPLYFLSELRKRFKETLKLSDEEAIFPDNGQYYVAIGAALSSHGARETALSELMMTLQKEHLLVENAVGHLAPLFKNEEEIIEFKRKHAENQVKRLALETYSGDAFLGIDCGSTTTKMLLIAESGELLYDFYKNNEGNPLSVLQNALIHLYEQMPSGVNIRNSCVTGYGEALIKTAFKVDLGEIETVAHYKAAKKFVPDVDFILDIGGQDMKCLTIKDGVINSVILNEACSAGCGSFIQNFSETLNLPLGDFVGAASKAKNPVDLGSRCTVFMNSKVKQAQKEGATVGDIASGLSYSVIKNALYKVIKMRSKEEMGRHIVVQGGTFYNDAILKAFEKIAGVEAFRPEISGLMGAYGCALLAKERYTVGYKSTLSSLEKVKTFAVKTTMTRCNKCTNKCILTVNQFPEKVRLITGNRCEKGAGIKLADESLPNLYEYKYNRIFNYEPLAKEKAKRGTVGIPRVLNLYENYGFWFTFFTTLGFRVVLSPASSKTIYEKGMDSIPSESVCYPAKLSHGHIMSLLESDIDFIFYPGVVFETKELQDATNNYNCPIVISYSENLRNNMDELKNGKIPFLNPFISLHHKQAALLKLVKVFPDIPKRDIRKAVNLAYKESESIKADIRTKGEEALRYIRDRHLKGIVLSGRPYHIDPEINHGIDKLITSFNMAVLTEDSVMHLGEVERPLRVVDQWVYHTRMYAAASFVAKERDLELLQLNSFGCGLDAVTGDQVKEILERHNKIYTSIKIDEVSNLGQARIRLRSLKAAMEERDRSNIVPEELKKAPVRRLFTKEMKPKHTILAPQMSPIHFEFLEAAVNSEGYRFEILKTADSVSVEEGLKYVNNDACYPSIMVTGQLVTALKSGKYDLNHTSVMISQTGGGCRATNYIAFIRKALQDAGFGHVPVISLNMSGLEKNPGFKLSFSLVKKLLLSVLYGDLLMRLLYRTRPYEKMKGKANALYKKWAGRCIDLVQKGRLKDFKITVPAIVADFDSLEQYNIKKPRIGLVGEILVKFHPDANNHIVEYLESEGAEAVMPDLFDFFLYIFKNMETKAKELYITPILKNLSSLLIRISEYVQKPMIKALEQSKHFSAPKSIHNIAEGAKKILSLCNQTGEGWFLTGEMVELIESGVTNVVCMQPFACLPNHVTGKGVIKKLRETYKDANIVAIDYDPGASEVNQINRIKLMLSVAFKNLKAEEPKEADAELSVS